MTLKRVEVAAAPGGSRRVLLTVADSALPRSLTRPGASIPQAERARLAGNGPAPETGHRRALIPVGGTPSIAQRFAIDYVRVGDDNLTFTGDRLKNASYHAYGQDALAVGE